MRYTPVFQGFGVVLLGSFNPTIFSPAWFKLYDLIPGLDLEKAKVQIVHDEYTGITLDNVSVAVQPDRFAVNTTTEPFSAALDVVLGTFGKMLPHTPVQQVGINYSLHFSLDSAEQRNNLGFALAPLAPWGAWGGGLVEGDKTKQGGLRSLVLEETMPEGRRDGGHRRVQIEPSVRVELLDSRSGVYMHVNDHYVISDEAPLGGAVDAMALLNDKFDASIVKAKSIVSDLMDFAASKA